MKTRKKCDYTQILVKNTSRRAKRVPLTKEGTIQLQTPAKLTRGLWTENVARERENDICSSTLY